MDVEAVRHAVGQGVVRSQQRGAGAVRGEAHQAARVLVNLLGLEGEIDIALSVEAKAVAVAHLHFGRQRQFFRHILVAELAGAAHQRVPVRRGLVLRGFEGRLVCVVMGVSMAGKGCRGQGGAGMEEVASVHLVGWLSDSLGKAGVSLARNGLGSFWNFALQSSQQKATNPLRAGRSWWGQWTCRRRDSWRSRGRRW